MAFDFARETEKGLRFALPFHSDEERGDTILPWFAATDDSQKQKTVVRDVLGEMIPALRETWKVAHSMDFNDQDGPSYRERVLTEKAAAIVGLLLSRRVP